jgi:uncharacterized protein YktB (UPF0637 family)
MKGFSERHFEAFQIPNLDARLEVIKLLIRPKLRLIGKAIEPMLSAELGEEFYYHVARHRRRRVNPPNDTWVAWSTSQHSYKSKLHFRVGIEKNFIYAQCGILSEYKHKKSFSRLLEKNWEDLKQQIPLNYVWSFREGFTFHIHANMIDDGRLLNRIIDDLRTINSTECVCGIIFDKNGEEVSNEEKLLASIQDVFRNLYPLYNMAKKAPLH